MAPRHPALSTRVFVPSPTRSAAVQSEDFAVRDVRDVSLAGLDRATSESTVRPDLLQALPLVPEQSLAIPTTLTIEGRNEAMPVRVNGRPALRDGDRFMVSAGPALIEVDRLDAGGAVVETRSGRTTIRAGANTIVRYADLAPSGSWSTQKKLLVAGAVALGVGGVVYWAARK